MTLRLARRDRRVTLFALECAFILQGCVGRSGLVNADISLAPALHRLEPLRCHRQLRHGAGALKGVIYR